MADRLKLAAETGNINGLYESIKENPDVLDRIDDKRFVDTPLHTAASAGHTDFAIEILRLMPSFGMKLNPNGQSSLHLALITEKFETVKGLINFDKKLIRVKGKEGITPLHLIAEKANNAYEYEQQSVAAERINILAEFLFACPNSIEDLTIRDETALHIAVKAKNQRAVQVILGYISRTMDKKRVLDYKDKNGNTALGMAVSASQDVIVSSLRRAEASSLWPMQIARSLRCAGALESSSCDPSHAEFLNSRERLLEVLFKAKILMRRHLTIELRNMGLVVAVLIATATFQAVLSPPGGVGGPGGNNLLTNGTNITAMVSSTNNQFAAITSIINATLFIPTDDPAKRLLFKGVKGAEHMPYGFFFLHFYYMNTCAFVLSMLMIMVLLPFRRFFLLHGALYFLMICYGTSFYLISPSLGYSLSLAIGSIICAFLVYFCRWVSFVFEASALGIESIARGLVKIPLSSVQKKRLQMLQHMMMNNDGQ